ncbi:hypothetical protein D9615_003837 [Tricholomella constricta]|uniref:Uncharacterized protein n=1 Tax=Tricholomella constricta TaxID=117010 RepID=A0A8H5HI66_9AGAR|nr:hypothetical protein D9615_003837 [Tricholomella constricta]
MTSIADSDTTTILQRFSQLALSEGLKKKSKQYKLQRREFIIGEVDTGFSTIFGGNASSLQSWMSLLRTVGVEGADGMRSIKQCKAALVGKYVNIVDLVDAAVAGIVMTSGVFTSSKALGKYMKRTGKTFPRNKAKTNQLLRQFLIRINE